MRVPNYFPPAPMEPRLAVIGEAPGEEEVLARRPFVGKSGYLLRELLGKHGVNLDTVFRGNVSQERPAGNKFGLFAWDGPEITEGLAALRADLARFKPSVVVLLGAQPLRAALCAKTSVEKLRGTLVYPMNGSPLRDLTCLSTYHPAACFREYRLRYTLAGDLGRALWVLRGHPHAPPAENYVLNPSPDEIRTRLRALRGRLAAVDIEGYPAAMSCFSIAWSATEAMTLPTSALDGPAGPAIREYLEDPESPKAFHNGLYDTFVLAWQPYGIHVRGWVEDTMLAQWELGCEFPKGLDYCASIHTWRPYWKQDRSATDYGTLARYCARDATATWEIRQKQKLEGGSLRHYRFNVDLLPAFLYMELRGIRYDVDGAAARRAELQRELWSLQGQLDLATGRDKPDVGAAILRMTLKKLKITDPSAVTPEACRKEWRDDAPRILALAAQRRRTPAEQGELCGLLGLTLNVESVRFRDYLYDQPPKGLGLTKQYKKTDEGPVLTAGETALLRLRKATGHPVVKLALEMRRLSTRIQMLGISADADGRIRAAYNPVGQETGRVSCYTSPTGSGYNLTTIPKDDRDLFLADEGHWLAQCDLKGADGWTVAANLKSLGAPQMWDDLTAGLKPANVLVIIRHDPSAANWTRAQLLDAQKAVDGDGEEYKSAKGVQHGTSYQMGAQAVCNKTFLDSDGEIDMSARDAQVWQDLFHARYHVRLWHGARMRSLRETGNVLTVPSGHRRHFTNWPERILGEALAHEAQANTTYATNMALRACWQDPENRDGKGRPIIECVHHIHDALLFHFPRKRLPFARRKIRAWFNNPIVIAGIPVTIPFSGTYGPSWGEQKEKL